MEARSVTKTENVLSQYERNIPDNFEVRFVVQGDWGFWETAAFYLGGVGAGLYVVSQFLSSWVGLIAGFILVLVFKNIAHLLSASRPARALRAFANPRTSWISRGAYCIVLFAVFGGLDIACRSGLIQEGDVMSKGISLLAACFACMIMTYIGFVMWQSQAIPTWHSPVLPVVFLTYSLALGTGAAFLTQSFGGTKNELDFLSRLFLMTAGSTLFLLFGDVGMMSLSSKAARFSVRLLTRGKLAVTFVGGALLAGLVIPLMMIAYALLANCFSHTLYACTGALVLAGGFMFETALLRAGVYSPLIDVG